MSTRSVFLEDIAFTVMNLALVCRLLFQAPFAWVAFQQPYQDHAELSIPLCIVTPLYACENLYNFLKFLINLLLYRSWNLDNTRNNEYK